MSGRISGDRKNNFETANQTHLRPAASAPVCWAGDVCVAGGQRFRFGHVFAFTWLQGFLFLCTDCLDAQHCPFSQTRAPTACWAFLPLPNPPSKHRHTKDAKISNLIVDFCWKKDNILQLQKSNRLAIAGLDVIPWVWLYWTPLHNVHIVSSGFLWFTVNSNASGLSSLKLCLCKSSAAQWWRTLVQAKH